MASFRSSFRCSICSVSGYKTGWSAAFLFPTALDYFFSKFLSKRIATWNYALNFLKRHDDMHWNRGYIDESSKSCNILHLRRPNVRQFWGSQTLEQIWSLKVDPFLVWPENSCFLLFVFADISSISSLKCRFGNGIQNYPSIDWTVLDTQKIFWFCWRVSTDLHSLTALPR